MSKKNTATTTTKAAKAAKPNAKKTGIEKIVDYLNANKAHIGAMVVSVAPMANKRISRFKDDGECDLVIMSADSVGAVDPEQMGHCGIRSPMTMGLAVSIKNMLIDKSGGIFG